MEGEKKDDQPKRPLQFSILHILVLTALSASALTIVLHFRHIGLVACCYLGAIIIGARRRKLRLLVGGLTALLVFAATYVACWVQMGYPDQMDMRGELNYSVLHDGHLFLDQFLFETRGSSGVFLSALISSLAAGFIWRSFEDQELSFEWLVMGVIAITISAVAVAFFLASVWPENGLAVVGW